MKEITLFPAVNVTDNGDGTATVTFDWSESIAAEHSDPDAEDDNRLSDAIDKWVGKPDTFHINIPGDRRIIQTKDPV